MTAATLLTAPTLLTTNSHSLSEAPMDQVTPSSSVHSFYEQVVRQLPIAGKDSFDRMKQIYEKRKVRVPDFKYEDLETLFQLKAKGKANTDQYQALREKIYDFCINALKNDKEATNQDQ